ncbi:alpha/beta hydrolase [Oricola indica]|jgi:alpha-beta hydrolase superfamily lysophospholipase|uniref:alpha/beta hydrolase n=1 Tax=Oricola indica TaxID=2872591 RepID=UPI001CBD5307|nr:alpha/beta hydrolase [Oricola indica]
MGFSERQIHASQTGAALCMRHEPASDGAIGVIHILHGLAEHSERYDAFARQLSQSGFHVYAHDHRGHGFTEAPGAPLGSFDSGGEGARLVLADIASIHDHVADAHPGLPVLLFGHSMGGTIALRYAFEHPESLTGVAAWNASLITGLLGRAGMWILAWERFRLGSDVPSRLLPRLTFGEWAKSVKSRRTEFDWLSRDPAAVDAYVADPLCGWPASVGMWRDVQEMALTVTDMTNAPEAARRLPWHLLGGGRDPATMFGKAVTAQVNRMRAAGFDDVTLELLPEMRHETLNEIDRDEAIAPLIRWFTAKAVSQASV